MKKEENTTQIALLGQNDVPKMLSQVIAQIKLIKGNLPETPQTNGNLPGFGKIQTIATLDELIKATSMINGKSEAYKKAAELIVPIGVKKPTFTIDGMSVDNMINHIKLRAIEVGNKEKLAKLNKIKSTLEENLSAEAKLANDLKKIQGMLTDEED